MRRTLVIALLLVGTSAFTFGRRCWPDGCPSAPEIDPGSTATASALCASVVLMVRRRRVK